MRSEASVVMVGLCLVGIVSAVHLFSVDCVIPSSYVKLLDLKSEGQGLESLYIIRIGVES